jgi:predicted DNA-binding transcriptional regulator AlpA
MEIVAAKSFEESPTTAAPIEGLMRRSELLRLVGCHYVTIWRMIRAGKFPKPVHYPYLGKAKIDRNNITSRAVAWRRSEVLAWLANLK